MSKTYPTTDRPLLPYLFFADLGAAIPWLGDAFGFDERFRLTLPNGAIAHAEISCGDGVVMLGNVGPRNIAAPTTTRSCVYVFVDDVDAHCERARAAGATIVQEPTDQPFGDRVYIALDCEGHEWYFAQHLRDVSIETLMAALAGQR